MAGDDKREQILSAARQLMLAQGPRATSMEAIAKAAQVAKPTLYKYYGDKSAVFAALVGELLIDLNADFLAALAEPGDIAARLTRAISAKYAAITRLVGHSPHAAELMGEEERRPTAQAVATEQAVTDTVTEALTAEGIVEAELLARTVLHAAWGLFRRAPSREAFEAELALMVGRMIGPAPRR